MHHCLSQSDRAGTRDKLSAPPHQFNRRIDAGLDVLCCLQPDGTVLPKDFSQVFASSAPASSCTPMLQHMWLTCSINYTLLSACLLPAVLQGQ